MSALLRGEAAALLYGNALRRILDYFDDPPEGEGFEYGAIYMPRVIAENALLEGGEEYAWCSRPVRAVGDYAPISAPSDHDPNHSDAGRT